MATLQKQSLFDPDVYQACLDRIEQLSPESRPHWGTMTVSQMLAHCAEIQEVGNGKPLPLSLPERVFVLLIRGMLRRLVLGDKPTPKGARTHPKYKQTRDCDFETEKRRLLAALEAVRSADPAATFEHPLLGPMDGELRGWGDYKHLNHHLTQFGV